MGSEKKKKSMFFLLLKNKFNKMGFLKDVLIFIKKNSNSINYSFNEIIKWSLWVFGKDDSYRNKTYILFILDKCLEKIDLRLPFAFVSSDV